MGKQKSNSRESRASGFQYGQQIQYNTIQSRLRVRRQRFPRDFWRAGAWRVHFQRADFSRSTIFKQILLKISQKYPPYSLTSTAASRFAFTVPRCCCAVSLVSITSALAVVGGGESPPDASLALNTHEPQLGLTIPSITPALRGKNVKDSSNPPAQDRGTTSAGLGGAQTNPDLGSGTESPSQLSRNSPESTKEKLIQTRLAAVWERTLKIANQTMIDNNLPPLDLDNLKSQSAEENMQSVIRKLETAHAQDKTAQWRYTWRGREIIVVERLGKILRGVQNHATIVDTAIQHSPEITALVWGGARAILQVGTFSWDSVARLLYSYAWQIAAANTIQYNTIHDRSL